MGRGSSKVGVGSAKATYYDREKARIMAEYAKKDGTLSVQGEKAMKNLDFQNYRFDGLEWEKGSNKYYRVQQYNPNSDNAIIRVADEHLIKTQYGYGFKTDAEHVVWVKDWQVNQNYYGNFVLANKKYWKEQKSKYTDNNLGIWDKKSSNRLDTFDKVKALAKEQYEYRKKSDSITKIPWEIKGSGKYGKGGKWE